MSATGSKAVNGVRFKVWFLKIKMLNCSGLVRNVSGSPRIVGSVPQGFDAHCDDYGTPYLTAAAAIGMRRSEVDTFVARLQTCLRKVLREKGTSGTEEAGAENAAAGGESREA